MLSRCFMLLFLLLVTFNGEFASADAQSQACFSQVCGGFNISYPFWLQTEDGAYCGYEGFEIKCSKARPILDLNSDAYFVKGINYNSKTLTVIDTELESNACPRPEKNVSFGNSPLTYAPQDTELFFFFNCSNDIIVSPPSGYLLPCLVNSDNHSSYAFLTRPAMANLYDHCEEVVVVPILESAASDWSGGVGGVVDKGFNLTWGSDDSGCISCENSGGSCGYNTSTESFVCYCKMSPSGSVSIVNSLYPNLIWSLLILALVLMMSLLIVSFMLEDLPATVGICPFEILYFFRVNHRAGIGPDRRPSLKK
ncbi:hypothetical protein AMTRI_Chr13g85020 [Amborella trichopoda]